jgi:hypothetical protein
MFKSVLQLNKRMVANRKCEGAGRGRRGLDLEAKRREGQKTKYFIFLAGAKRKVLEAKGTLGAEKDSPLR